MDTIKSWNLYKLPENYIVDCFVASFPWECSKSLFNKSLFREKLELEFRHHLGYEHESEWLSLFQINFVHAPSKVTMHQARWEAYNPDWEYEKFVRSCL